LDLIFLFFKFIFESFPSGFRTGRNLHMLKIVYLAICCQFVCICIRFWHLYLFCMLRAYPESILYIRTHVIWSLIIILIKFSHKILSQLFYLLRSFTNHGAQPTIHMRLQVKSCLRELHFWISSSGSKELSNTKNVQTLL
jgi:hypothetical protein